MGNNSVHLSSDSVPVHVTNKHSLDPKQKFCMSLKIKVCREKQHLKEGKFRTGCNPPLQLRTIRV